MAGLLAYFAARATLTLKRAAISYGLMALGALIAVFALGYALNAGYPALMVRYGPIAASLTIAGGLAAVAASCVVAARIVSRRPRRVVSAPPELNPQYSHLHLARAARPRVLALSAGLAGAATMGAAILGFRKRRNVRNRISARTAD